LTIVESARFGAAAWAAGGHGCPGKVRAIEDYIAGSFLPEVREDSSCNIYRAESIDLELRQENSPWLSDE